MFLLLHKTLKGSRNIQGFALIRAVLSFFDFSCELQITITLLGWKGTLD